MDIENTALDTEATEATTTDAPAETPIEDVSGEPTATGDMAEGATGEATPAEGEEPAPQRREVARGIHPELLCHCEECDPEFTELQWFSPEEKKKTRGDLMLYCQRSGRKYFTPAAELHTWLAANPIKAAGRSRE